MLKLKSMSADGALLLLRLVVGFGFIDHAYAKLMRGPLHFVEILSALKVPMPYWMGWTTILVELFGGIALMIGAFVSVVSLPLSIIMLVAMFTVHLPFGFSSIKLQSITTAGPQFGPPGYELNLLYLASLIMLAFGGAGIWSVDHFLEKRKKP